MNKLHFLTPGIPHSSKPKKTMENGLRRIKELGLGGMELEFVRGIMVDFPRMQLIGKLAKELGLILTAHAPYYIDLYAREKEKVDKSYQFILDTARSLDAAGGFSMVFHAAYYLGTKPDEVYESIKKHIGHIAAIARKEALRVWLRPELMGKNSQFGTLDEIVRLSRDVGGRIAPCIDFAHLHARTGRFNTYEEFAFVFEKIGSELGESALENMHMHFSGILYSMKGEQKHVILRKSDLRFREFAKALKDFNISGALTVESPNIVGDTLLMKLIYESM
jgi:deoxyribonuclease-4